MYSNYFFAIFRISADVLAMTLFKIPKFVRKRSHDWEASLKNVATFHYTKITNQLKSEEEALQLCSLPRTQWVAFPSKSL